MNIRAFIDEVGRVFPSGSELQPAQISAYKEKLMRFTDHQRQAIYDHVLEHCKYFPKIADVYEAAEKLGYLATKPEYKPHVWQSTDCAYCVGSGLVAAMWEQEFTKGAEAMKQTLKLVHMGPYHRSADYLHAHTSVIRTVYRCQCPIGDAATLEKGLPRWSRDHAVTIERGW